MLFRSLGTDTVQFKGNYIVPNSNLTVNSEHIKVDPGVSICLGNTGSECTSAPTSNGNLTFNAVYKDDGLSILGITTTIPVLGTDGLVDISDVLAVLWRVVSPTNPNW